MICPYCEKERDAVNCAGVIDDDFSYSCIVCNLEFVNWLTGAWKHKPYESKMLQNAVDKMLNQDKENQDEEWRPNLKTIAFRSQLFRDQLGIMNK